MTALWSFQQESSPLLWLRAAGREWLEHRGRTDERLIDILQDRATLFQTSLTHNISGGNAELIKSMTINIPVS